MHKYKFVVVKEYTINAENEDEAYTALMEGCSLQDEPDIYSITLTNSTEDLS